MRDDQRGPDPKAGSPDRKTRVKGDRVIHIVKGNLYQGDAAERPRGLTTEQWESQRTGAKLDERQTREAAHDGLGGKQQVERLDGTDDVASTRKGRG
ncbi:MAG: hypothetical protein JO197_22225 [Acidobacteria bacterium]|nr:hypothetical protein [Acidobacteriota bacterium]MBV9474855.1 hypothetical protein [Acidobacteriota bacterium]